MNPATLARLNDCLTLHRIFVAFVLVGFAASFCVPLFYVRSFTEPFWHPGPTSGSILFGAIQSPAGFIPAAVVLAANLFLAATLLRSLVPDSLQAILALYGFATFTSGFALASSLVAGVVFILWSLNAWAVGPGAYLWLG